MINYHMYMLFKSTTPVVTGVTVTLQSLLLEYDDHTNFHTSEFTV